MQSLPDQNDTEGRLDNRAGQRRWSRRKFLVALLMLGCLVTSPLVVSAHQPEETEHGLPADVFIKLWSGDEDAGSVEEESEAVADLMERTDWSFAEPPQDVVGQWNKRDLADFEPGDAGTSVYPPNASLTDGRFVKDAYTAFAAVQPATRVHASNNTTPLYVRPNGEALATVDYRINVPLDDTDGGHRVYWSIDSHEIKTVRLTGDDTVLASTDGTHTPVLTYSDLDLGNRPLTVEAVISVTMQKKIRKKHVKKDEDCEGVDEDEAEEIGEEDDECETKTWWTTHYQYPSETVTVTAARTPTVYRLTPTARYARFPDGSVEILVTADEPWRSFTVQDASITGTWRFYTARNTRWNILTESTAESEESTHSPSHPLQIHAYPSKAGVVAEPAIDGPTVVATWGPQRRPPQLPDAINVDVVNRSYNTTSGIVVRLTTVPPDQVTVHGIVGGETTLHVSGEQVRRSNLTVEVINVTERNVTVEVTLRDNATGQPIDLTDREGVIKLSGGHTVTTNADGTVTATVPKPISTVSASYHPGPWWRTNPSYAGSQAVAFLPAEFPSLITLLLVAIRFGILFAGVLAIGYIVDRIIGGSLWPPWRM